MCNVMVDFFPKIWYNKIGRILKGSGVYGEK